MVTKFKTLVPKVTMSNMKWRIDTNMHYTCMEYWIWGIFWLECHLLLDPLQSHQSLLGWHHLHHPHSEIWCLQSADFGFDSWWAPTVLLFSIEELPILFIPLPLPDVARSHGPNWKSSSAIVLSFTIRQNILAIMGDLPTFKTKSRQEIIGIHIFWELNLINQPLTKGVMRFNSNRTRRKWIQQHPTSTSTMPRRDRPICSPISSVIQSIGRSWSWTQKASLSKDILVGWILPSNGFIARKWLWKSRVFWSRFSLYLQGKRY